MTKFLLPALIAVLLIPGTIRAANTSEAETRVHDAVDAVLAIAGLATDSRSLPTSLRPVLSKHLSFEAMTRRAIGPGWRQFTSAQKKEATELFTTLIIRTYSNKFTPGEHPEVTFKPALEPAPGRFEIPTKLIYQGKRYDVIYRVEASENMRITDVVIEGVSLVANYRSQLDAQFKSGGADSVINSLSKTVDRSQ